MRGLTLYTLRACVRLNDSAIGCSPPNTRRGDGVKGDSAQIDAGRYWPGRWRDGSVSNVRAGSSLKDPEPDAVEQRVTEQAGSEPKTDTRSSQFFGSRNQYSVWLQ